ncbi:hypothetical protein EXN66_Car001108 [Channa argus]|uniref:Uncharacterized protein n=1 Tax=Channa argus TaxID=215402 RepID=A0A6G1QZI3_CHAAH|nr:hypothetical protein EXN66_Car001108 [Channa argus]
MKKWLFCDYLTIIPSHFPSFHHVSLCLPLPGILPEVIQGTDSFSVCFGLCFLWVSH